MYLELFPPSIQLPKFHPVPIITATVYFHNRLKDTDLAYNVITDYGGAALAFIWTVASVHLTNPSPLFALISASEKYLFLNLLDVPLSSPASR